MHYKVREVGEVDNRTLHRGFDMPGRSNAFTLMATNAPSCFPKELREIMGRCRSAWDFTSDCYFTASNNLDQGSVVNRFGEPLKTCDACHPPDTGVPTAISDTPKISKAYHVRCKGCHQYTVRKLNKVAGPVRCRLCHLGKVFDQEPQAHPR